MIEQSTNFRKGDKVLIQRKAKTHERGWGNSWVDEMNYAVGKIGTIVEDFDPYGLKFNVVVKVGEETFGYPLFVLQPVMFKAGDRVKVTYGFGWNGESKVESIGEYGISVRYDSGRRGAFDPKHLELITGIPVQEVQAKEAGIARAVKGHSRVFVIAKEIAINLGKTGVLVNADLVQEGLTKCGFSSADLGNAAGALFRGKNWKLESTQKSARKGSHAREIKNWKYVGA